MTTPSGQAPKILPCPSCRTDFVVGVAKCGACGVTLTGPLAVRSAPVANVGTLERGVTYVVRD